MEASVATIGAVWTRGVCGTRAAAAAESTRTSSSTEGGGGGGSRPRWKDRRWARGRKREASGGGTNRRSSGEGRDARGAGELYPVDGERSVVLDVRDAIAVKVRLTDEGAADGGGGGGGGGGRGGGVGGGGSEESLHGASPPVAMAVDRDNDLGVAELPPPAAVKQEVGI